MAFAAAVHPLKRGALAKRYGCNIETIRYYENIGLLRAPDRTESGHRLYSPRDQARLGFILRARELGFSMEEIRSLLSLADSRGYTCGDVLALSEHHLDDIRTKIRDLSRLERTLTEMAERCAGGDVPDCPVMDALLEGV